MWRVKYSPILVEIGSQNLLLLLPVLLLSLLLLLLLVLLLLLFTHILSLDTDGRPVAPRIHSNYFKYIYVHFGCSALELTKFLFVFWLFRNLHGFKSSRASVSAIVTWTRHLDISLGLVIKRVRSKLTPEHEFHRTVGFHLTTIGAGDSFSYVITWPQNCPSQFPSEGVMSGAGMWVTRLQLALTRAGRIEGWLSVCLSVFRLQRRTRQLHGPIPTDVLVSCCAISYVPL